MTDYAEYMQSDEWKRKRTRIRRRARGWCERCLVGQRADVHHVTYARLGHEELSDLVAVCQYCHEFLHGKRTLDPAAMTYTEEERGWVRTFEEFPFMREYVTTNEVAMRAWRKRKLSLGEPAACAGA